ncbi:WD40 repeat domain-containing protein [Streptomyces sp. NPDC059909]|uniref:WD40 repeat domain-containing protein n=1 Tax=Streptomyces sp. NPDC059909 TaxID=3346998 RepID=UPI003666DEFD
MSEPGKRLHALSLPYPVNRICWTPDGAFLAVASGRPSGDTLGGGAITVINAYTGRPIWQPDATLETEAEVDSVAVSSDGAWLAVPRQGTTGVHAVASGKVRCVNPEQADAEEVAFSPDGSCVAAIGSSTGFVAGLLVWVFDAVNGDTKWQSSGDLSELWQSSRLVFSPDSRRLAVIRGAEAFVCDVNDPAESTKLPETVRSIAFSPDSRSVIAGMADGKVRIRNLETGGELVTPLHDPVGVLSLAVSPDGQWIAAVAERGPAVLSAVTGAHRFDPITDIEECTKVVYSPDLRFFAVNQIPGSTPGPGITVLDARTGTPKWSDRSSDLARDIAFAPDGSRVVIGGVTAESQGFVHVYDTGVERATVEHGGPVSRVAMGKTAFNVAATVAGDQRVRAFRADTGENVLEGTHPSPVTSLAISADSQSVATGCLDGSARLFRTLYGLVWAVDHGQPVNAVAIDAAGDAIATACGDRTARVLDLATGHERCRHAHRSGVTAVVFNPDGTLIATGSNRTTSVIDAASGQLRHELDGDGKVRALAFSRNGLLATGNEDGRVRVIDPASGEVRRTVVHPRPVTAVAFSPDGTLLATGGVDRTVRISRLTEEESTEALSLTYDAPITALVFHPKDQALAVATENPTVKVIEVTTGLELYRVLHPGPVRDLAFNVDGELLVTACEDGNARVVAGRLG